MNYKNVASNLLEIKNLITKKTAAIVKESTCVKFEDF